MKENQLKLIIIIVVLIGVALLVIVGVGVGVGLGMAVKYVPNSAFPIKLPINIICTLCLVIVGSD